MTKEVKEVHVKFDLELLANSNKEAKKLKKSNYASKEEWQIAIANKKSDIMKKDISWFLTRAYQFVRGGKLAKRYYDNVEKETNGNSNRQYSPDVLHRGFGTQRDIEVKALCNSFGGSLKCAIPQFEKYFHKLLKRYDEIDAKKTNFLIDKTGFEYAFFRYSAPMTYKLIKGHYPCGQKRKKKMRKGLNPSSMKAKELVEYIAQNTKDLLITPPNLLILLLHHASRGAFNQFFTNEKIQEYWYVKSGDVSALHNLQSNGLKYILKDQNNRFGSFKEGKNNYVGTLTAKQMHLDALIPIQNYSPKIIINKKYIIDPFIITRYKFESKDSYLSWINFLRENHEQITFDLDIKDLYAEDKKIPF